MKIIVLLVRLRLSMVILFVPSLAENFQSQMVFLTCCSTRTKSSEALSAVNDLLCH